MLIREILKTAPAAAVMEVKGWVRTRRDAGGLSFIEINDGSCLGNLQIVAQSDMDNFETLIRKLTTGCAVRFTGKLAASPAKGQDVEFQAESVEVYGWSPAESYPLQKKRHSFEFLRNVPHLRPRTNSIGSVMRIRGRLAIAIGRFFEEQGFVQVHTPVISTSDCEGAGEMFSVTTPGPGSGGGESPCSTDFFGRPAGLTVSGQLEAEAYALALGRVYTFGPTFRAENSHTSRHLAEFWMVEPEMAFCDLDEDIDLAEKFLKFLIADVLDNCREDLELFTKFVDKDLRNRLETVTARAFARTTYGEAVRILAKSGKKFEYPISWGADFQAEHEKFLTEEVFGKPTVVTDYPASIKPFYMRLNDDGKTVAAMDVLFPAIGEIIGGSRREDRYAVLEKRMAERNIDPDAYRWYLDLRRYGSAPHAGFGMGFERLVQFVTGMANIRDVIPFPRTAGRA
ncbi:MAG: asparagine--tRNA ligase [Desulfurivibrionaceae bacterium]|nr:asparagine--tRNA ligase [Desulfobulbales bacterium]MDT8335930.1 asparagine--tRNA ligase [Desulfurivibrionaceae bacterium]